MILFITILAVGMFIGVSELIYYLFCKNQDIESVDEFKENWIQYKFESLFSSVFISGFLFAVGYAIINFLRLLSYAFVIIITFYRNYIFFQIVFGLLFRLESTENESFNKKKGETNVEKKKNN